MSNLSPSDRPAPPTAIPQAGAHVLVTGASGFVGRAVLANLSGRVAVTALARLNPPTGDAASDETGAGAQTRWRSVDITRPLPADLFDGITHVVHLAGLAAAPRTAEGVAALEAVNVAATRALAEAAAAAKVARFVFMSSLHVHGVRPPRQPVRPESPLIATDPYGASKIAAERMLANLAATGLPVVALRPPLVAGPGAGGNLARLTALIDRGLPLPFGGIANARPMITADSLAEAVFRALFADGAAGPYVVADDGALSTADLVRAIARGLGRRPRLLPIPTRLAETMLRAAGRSGAADRLFGSVVVDSGAAVAELGWRPAEAVEPALVAMAQAWKQATSR